MLLHTHICYEMKCITEVSSKLFLQSAVQQLRVGIYGTSLICSQRMFVRSNHAFFRHKKNDSDY